MTGQNGTIRHILIGGFDCAIGVTVSEQGKPIGLMIDFPDVGLASALSTAVTLGLEHDIPLLQYVKRFIVSPFHPHTEPEARGRVPSVLGCTLLTDDRDVPCGASFADIVFRRTALDYLSEEERRELGILTADEYAASRGALPV